MSTSYYEFLNQVPDDAVAVAPPEEYVDSGATLIPEGTYDIVVKEFQPEFEKDGTFQNRISLKTCTIRGVPENLPGMQEGESRKLLGRKLTNLTIFTTVYNRKGTPASGLGDFIRGIDADLKWTGLKEAIDVIQEAVDKQTPVQCRLVWGAYDKKGWEQAGGKNLRKGTDEFKELSDRVRVKGMKSFKQMPDGTFYPEVLGPISGEILEGRLEIAAVVSSRKRRELVTE